MQPASGDRLSPEWHRQCLNFLYSASRAQSPSSGRRANPAPRAARSPAPQSPRPPAAPAPAEHPAGADTLRRGSPAGRPGTPRAAGQGLLALGQAPAAPVGAVLAASRPPLLGAAAVPAAGGLEASGMPPAAAAPPASARVPPRGSLRRRRQSRQSARLRAAHAGAQQPWMTRRFSRQRAAPGPARGSPAGPGAVRPPPALPRPGGTRRMVLDRPAGTACRQGNPPVPGVCQAAGTA